MKGKLHSHLKGINSYMADISLPETLSNEFIALIPKQRAFVKKMMNEGVISNYSLSSDRKKLWVIINAATRFDAHNIIGSFPISNYIRYTINNLLFHETNVAFVPHMWLN